MMRIAAEDPASHNFDPYLWRQAKKWPPLGTPAQTISFPEEGKCRMCLAKEKLDMVDKDSDLEEKADGETVVKVGYPVDLVFVPPGNGQPWVYQRPATAFWVYVLDGWKGKPLVDENGAPMVHMSPVLGRPWVANVHGQLVKNVNDAGHGAAGNQGLGLTLSPEQKTVMEAGYDGDEEWVCVSSEEDVELL